MQFPGKPLTPRLLYDIETSLYDAVTSLSSITLCALSVFCEKTNSQIQSNEKLFMHHQSLFAPTNKRTIWDRRCIHSVGALKQNLVGSASSMRLCSFIFQAYVIRVNSQRQSVDYFHSVCSLNVFIAAECLFSWLPFRFHVFSHFSIVKSNSPTPAGYPA